MRLEPPSLSLLIQLPLLPLLLLVIAHCRIYVVRWSLSIANVKNLLVTEEKKHKKLTYGPFFVWAPILS
jgi:hypothetical protein